MTQEIQALADLKDTTATMAQYKLVQQHAEYYMVLAPQP